MEVLSQLLDKNIEEFSFDYHPKCEESNLSHISFADDLFIVAAVSHKSMQVIQKMLDEFLVY